MKLLITKRFRTKVLLLMLGFSAFFIAIVWLLQIGFLENYYEYAKEKSVRSSANQIEQMLKRYRLDEMTESLEEIAFNGNLCVELRDLQGNSEFVMDMAGRDCVIHSNKSLLVTQLMNLYRQSPNNEMGRTLTSFRFDTQSFLLIREITDYNGVKHLLWVSSPLLPVKSTTDILKDQFKLIIIILIVTALLVSLFLSNSITKPVQKISDAAQRVAAGHYDTKVEISGEDELSQLAENFNYMIDELGKVESTRQELLANISHDLRTPLTMIKGYAEAIKDITGNDPVKRDAQLEVIMKESDRLSLLVNDVLNFTTLNQEGYKLHPSSFDIGMTICDIVERYKIIANDFQINYLGALGCRVVADKQRIEQVIYNLINNAINHAGVDKQIIIDLQRTKTHCKISITDHGDGIAKEHLPLIWDRYYKINKSGKRPNMGTGLGLSIVKSILKSHKANFGVESKLRKGTTFWFELPLYLP